MADAKVSALTAATPLTTDVVYLVDDPDGTPSSKQATVSELLAAGTGYTIHRLTESMTNGEKATAWSAFWTDTADAMLIVERRVGGGTHNVGTADVVCSGAAAEAHKVVFGNMQEVYAGGSGSLTWRGEEGAGGFRTLYIDKLYYTGGGSAHDWNGTDLDAGLVFQNMNFQRIDIRTKATKVLMGTYGKTGDGGQFEFNDITLDMSNCTDEAALEFRAMSSPTGPNAAGQNYGNNSMRGNRIHAKVFGSGIKNAFKCGLQVYHSQVAIHTGGIGRRALNEETVPRTPTGNPTTDLTFEATGGVVTGAEAVFWFTDGTAQNKEPNWHGTDWFLRDESPRAGAVCLWVDDNDNPKRQEYGFVDLATIWRYDYMAVTTLPDQDRLPRYLFGINQQTQDNTLATGGFIGGRSWTHATESWWTDFRSNVGGKTLVLE